MQIYFCYQLFLSLFVINEYLREIAILIPARQPDQHLPKLVSSLLALGFLKILMVDDGSDESHAPVIQACVMDSRVRAVTHAINMGKSRALKTGFNEILTAYPGLLGVVTCDADGQHRAKDVLTCCCQCSCHRAGPADSRLPYLLGPHALAQPLRQFPDPRLSSPKLPCLHAFKQDDKPLAVRIALRIRLLLPFKLHPKQGGGAECQMHGSVSMVRWSVYLPA